jgi:hypothetical protein
LVIHILVPLSTKRSFFFSAPSRIDTTSDPEPVSDIASAPTASPAQSAGRNFCFCASVPQRRI